MKRSTAVGNISKILDNSLDFDNLRLAEHILHSLEEWGISPPMKFERSNNGDIVHYNIKYEWDRE